eukprot:4095998-Amphidinium_carterae.1
MLILLADAGMVPARNNSFATTLFGSILSLTKSCSGTEPAKRLLLMNKASASVPEGIAPVVLLLDV